MNNVKDAATENNELEAQAGTIIECFKTGDIDTLEAMFCEESRVNNDLPSQILEAFDCIDGDIVSYDYLNFG